MKTLALVLLTSASLSAQAYVIFPGPGGQFPTPPPQAYNAIYEGCLIGLGITGAAMQTSTMQLVTYCTNIALKQSQLSVPPTELPFSATYQLCLLTIAQHQGSSVPASYYVSFCTTVATVAYPPATAQP